MPAETPSGTPTPHTAGAVCYVAPRSTEDLLAKRGSKREIHRRRLVRRGN